MPSSTDLQDSALTLRWPCTLIRAIGFDPTQELEVPTLSPLSPTGDPVPLDPGWLAILPTAGDPATSDRALEWGDEILARAPDDAKILILPGLIEVGPKGATRCRDTLQEDLEAQPPEMNGSRIAITTRAALGLERPRRSGHRFVYRGPSGRSVALTSPGAPELGALPWRNPELLGHTTAWMERTSLAAALETLLDCGAMRVLGTLGTGKTRLVHQVLARGLRPYIRTSILPRAASKTTSLPVRLGEQLRGSALQGPFASALSARPQLRRIASHLASGKGSDAALIEALLTQFGDALGAPVVLLVDDVETLPAADSSLLGELASLARQGEGFRLVTVGRPTPTELTSEGTPPFPIPSCTDAEMEELIGQVGSTLTLPELVRERLLNWVAGNPLALEFTLTSLVHSKLIKQVYGSFVYTGDEDAPLATAARWHRHVLAEALRMGRLPELLIVAAADHAVPSSEVRSAISTLGVSSDSKWESTAIECGLLRRTDSPWGEAVALAGGAVQDVLKDLLSPNDTIQLRHSLGELLAELASTPEGRRAAWEMVAGSSAGAEMASDLARSSSADLQPNELVRMLRAELAALRDREGPVSREFELLWQLLRQPALDDEVARKEMQRAMELSQDSPKRRLALSLVRSDRAARRGALTESAAALRDALAAGEGRTEHQVRILLRWGRLELRRERFQSARRHFANLLAALPPEGHPAIDECRFQLGNLLMHAGRPEEALRQHEQVLEHRSEPKHGSEPSATAASLCAIGAARLAIGEYPGALSAHNEALQRLGADAPIEERAVALRGLGRSLNRVGDYAAARTAFEESVALFRSRQDRVGEAVSNLSRAGNRLGLDQLDEAVADALDALYYLRLAGVQRFVAYAQQVLGRIYLRRRSPEQAADYLTRAAHIHRRLGDVPGENMDLALLVEEAVLRGSEEGVRQRAAQLEKRLDSDRPADRKQQLDFQLYRAWRWLQDRGVPDGEPQLPLTRAYTELMRRAGQLSAERRHQFLQQIPVHSAILEAAKLS